MEPAESQPTTTPPSSLAAPPQVAPQVAAPPVEFCPVCKHAALPDQFGFVECACGWGGPGDPVEAARGFSRWVTLRDRRLATGVAQRELARIAKTGRPTSARNLLYAALLSLLSVAIYLIVGALFVGSVVLFVQTVMAENWVGAVLVGLIVLYLFWALFGLPQKVEGIVAPIAEHPRLAATMGEIAARVGVKPPRWVVLAPDADFWIARKMLWGRALTPQIVVAIGVAALTQMNDPELRAVLTHELAHYRREHTFFVRFFGGAERALAHIIDGIKAGISTNYKNDWYAQHRSSSSLAVLVGVVIIWIVTLPLRLLWFVFHLLRMRLSRSDEYEADRMAIQTYGARSFTQGLMALISSEETLRGAGASIVDDMKRRNNPNLYAELRRHYAELPSDAIERMRWRAVKGYRGLEQTHPITPDRVRAALLIATPEPALAFRLQPVSNIITPAGAPDASETELRLTQIIFARGKRRRR